MRSLEKRRFYLRGHFNFQVILLHDMHISLLDLLVHPDLELIADDGVEHIDEILSWKFFQFFFNWQELLYTRIGLNYLQEVLHCQVFVLWNEKCLYLLCWHDLQ